MAIIGEDLKDYVINQIKVRQQVLGKDGGYTPLSDDNIFAFNSQTSWVKLASGVFVTEDKLKKLGITEPSLIELYRGKELAKNFILNGGTARMSQLGGSIIQREGLNPIGSEEDEDGNTYSFEDYQKGSYEPTPSFGFVPMAGLTDVSVKCLNRGSLKKAKIKLRVENKQQLSIIDVLYLRLGYTMLLEWGNSHYLDNNKNIQSVGLTLTEDANGFFNDSFNLKSNPYKLLKVIEDKRKEYLGNYDGFLGKVSNFDWSFNEDGSYDINLELISLGDVIETLKSNITIDTDTQAYIHPLGSGSNNLLIGEGNIINDNKDSNPIMSILYQWKYQNRTQVPGPTQYVNQKLEESLVINNINFPKTSSPWNEYNLKKHIVAVGDICKPSTNSTIDTSQYDYVFTVQVGYDPISGIKPTSAYTSGFNLNLGTKIQLLAGQAYANIPAPMTYSFRLTNTTLLTSTAVEQWNEFLSTIVRSSKTSPVLSTQPPNLTISNNIGNTSMNAWNIVSFFLEALTSGIASTDLPNWNSGKAWDNGWVEAYQNKAKRAINWLAVNNPYELVQYDDLNDKDYKDYKAGKGSRLFTGYKMGRFYSDTSAGKLEGTNAGNGVLTPAGIENSEIDKPYINKDNLRVSRILKSRGKIIPNVLSGAAEREVVRLYNMEEDGVRHNYDFYIRFGYLLQLFKDYVISRIDTDNPSEDPLIVDINNESNPYSSNFISFMRKRKNQISFDPRICIVNSSIEFKTESSTGSDTSRINFFGKATPSRENRNGNKAWYGDDTEGKTTSSLRLWDISTTNRLNTRPTPPGAQNPSKYNTANSMNIYIGFNTIGDVLMSNTDEDGNISIYSFLKDLCSQINLSFGGVNSLEPVIDETTNTLSIVDSNKNNSVKNDKYALNPFGFVNNNTEGSFVRKVDLKTAITPAYATMVTVGATAGGYVKGVEATSFAKWNDGIEDRFKTGFISPRESATLTTTETIQDVVDAFFNICGNSYISDGDEIGPLRVFGVASDMQYDLSLNYKNDKLTAITSEIGYASSQRFPSYNVMMFNWNDGIIKSNQQIASEYFKGASSLNKDEGSIGFIPFNVGLKMDGISGVKIYNKIELNTRFLPDNYSTSLNFIVTAVNHSLKGNDWETELKLTLIPNPIPTTNTPSPSSYFISTPTPPPTPAPTPSPPSPSPSGVCGTPPSTVGDPGNYISPPAKGAPGDYVDVMKTINSSGNKKLRKFNNCEYPIKLYTKPGDTSGTLYSKVIRNNPSTPGPKQRNVYELNPAFVPFLKTLTYPKKYNGSSGQFKIYNVNKNWFPTIEKIIQHLDSKGMWNSSHIKSFSPGFVRRDVTPASGPIYGQISSHAYGMAMDINSSVYPLGSAGVTKWENDFAAGVKTALVHQEIYTNFVLTTPPGCQPVFWLKDNNDAHHFSVMIKV